MYECVLNIALSASSEGILSVIISLFFEDVLVYF